MQNREAFHFGDGGEEQIRGGHPAMRSDFDERTLELNRAAFGPRGDKYGSEALKEGGLAIMIVKGARRIPDLQSRDDTDSDQAARDARVEMRFDRRLHVASERGRVNEVAQHSAELSPRAAHDLGVAKVPSGFDEVRAELRDAGFTLFA